MLREPGSSLSMTTGANVKRAGLISLYSLRFTRAEDNLLYIREEKGLFWGSLIEQGWQVRPYPVRIIVQEKRGTAEVNV